MYAYMSRGDGVLSGKASRYFASVMNGIIFRKTTRDVKMLKRKVNSECQIGG